MNKLIDEKGKLFGLINVIDLFVVLLIICAVGFLGLKFLKPAVATVSNTDDVVLSFYCEQTPDYVANSVLVGGKVEDDQKNANLGTVTSVKIDKGFMYVANDMGELKKATMENYSSVEVKTDAKGQIIENGGIKIDGNTYTIGHGFTIRAGNGKLYVRFAGFEKK